MNIQIEGLDELRARLARMRSATLNLDPALLRSGVVVLTAAQQRINAGGPGWAPTVQGTMKQAVIAALQRAGKRVPKKVQNWNVSAAHATGRLLASLTVSGADNINELSGNQIVVGTSLPYAKFMQEGTGIYGDRGAPITPTSKQALSFMIGGSHFIVKSIKGAPKRPFLYIDAQIVDRVSSIFAAHVMARSGAET